MNYWLLFPGDSVDELEMPDELFERHAKSLCWYCDAPMTPEALPGDITVSRKPRNVLIQSIDRYDGMIVREDFVDIVGHDVFSGVFRTGKVLGRDGNVVEGYLTAYPKRPLLLRNGRNLGSRLCKFCGRIVLTSADSVILKSQVTSTPPLLGTEHTWFLVSDDLMRRFSKSALRLMRTEKLTVLDEPRDGLPDNLDPVPSLVQKNIYLKAGGIEDYMDPYYKKIRREKGKLIPGENFDAHDWEMYAKWLKS